MRAKSKKGIFNFVFFVVLFLFMSFLSFDFGRDYGYKHLQLSYAERVCKKSKRTAANCAVAELAASFR